MSQGAATSPEGKSNAELGKKKLSRGSWRDEKEAESRQNRKEVIKEGGGAWTQ